MRFNKVGTDIAFAYERLQGGGLVGIPTETVYGLAANALDERAVAGIFEAKQRPTFDPLIVHVAHLDDLFKYVNKVPLTARELAEAFWPGPLTLVLEKQSTIPDLVTAGHPTVAVRIPNHPLTLDLLEAADFPLAAPSANPFGYVSPTRAKHVYDQLGEQVDYVLDGGPCQVGVESTIVQCTESSVRVLRLGGLPLESIEAVLGQPVDEVKTSSSNPSAPGMLSSHYAPSVPVELGTIPELLKKTNREENVGVLLFGDHHPDYSVQHQFNLSQKGDLNEAAANLFNVLRAMDRLKVDRILAERVPDRGIGRAINDRLSRAAAR